MPSHKQTESIDKRSAKSEAVKFLEDLLKDGPVCSQAVLDAATQAGINEKTLQRAKKGMGIKSKKDSGYAGGWSWTLPAIEENQESEMDNKDGQEDKMDNQDGQAKRNVHLTLNQENTGIYRHNLPKDGQDSASVHLTKNDGRVTSFLWQRCPNCGKDKYITKPCAYCEHSAA